MPEEIEEQKFEELERDFKREVDLLRHFIKLFSEKENLVKKIMNEIKTRFHTVGFDKNKKLLLEKNKALLELLNKIIKSEAFEEIIIAQILGEEQKKSLQINEIKDIAEVKYNLLHIKKFLMELRELIEGENPYLEKNINSQSFTRADEITAEITRLLRNELNLFQNIKLYYVQVFRKIQDYIKNLLQKKPLISVIIPAFNEEKLIQRCLRSLVRQVYPNKELIVVDNKSTDNTHKMIAPYTYYYSHINIQGVSMAKNTGAKLAHGGILVFLDADCMAPQALLQGIHLAFLQGYNCGKVADVRGDKGGWRAKLATRNWLMNDKIHKITGYPAYGAGACMFCDKNLFFQIGGFNTELKASEDVNLMERMIKNGKFKYITKNFYYTSMRRFTKQGYLLTSLQDTLITLLPQRFQRAWVR